MGIVRSVRVLSIVGWIKEIGMTQSKRDELDEIRDREANIRFKIYQEKLASPVSKCVVSIMKMKQRRSEWHRYLKYT